MIMTEAAASEPKKKEVIIMEANTMINENEKKQIHVPSMVLMIVGAVFSLLFTYVTYVCSTISLVMSIKRRKTHKTTYAVVINIIALLLALANSVVGIMLQMGVIQLPL